MRIVSRDELKAMPVGTLYADYHPGRGWPSGPESIFLGECSGINDFYCVSINDPEASGSSELFEREHQMDTEGTRFPLALSTDREGLYEDDLRYLVWEPEDIAEIVARTHWFGSGQGQWNATTRYRVRRADGSVRFAHDEEDARHVARSGGVVERMHERHETDWRAVP